MRAHLQVVGKRDRVDFCFVNVHTPPLVGSSDADVVEVLPRQKFRPGAKPDAEIWRITGAQFAAADSPAWAANWGVDKPV
eukprot:SAG31_NODE_7322_length_1719_cov_1.414815_2_plen_80_part_00